jgi:NitT/TauT family transport system substrate-binding protein
MKAKKGFTLGLLVFVFLLWSSVGLAAGLVKVRASHQPCMHALPTILCQKLGWFKELGIDVSFHFYSSGMPQVEAGLAGEWDVGAIGTSPAFFAGMRHNFPIIACSNDESVTNNVMVRKKDYKRLTQDPKKTLKGTTWLVSTISTGHHVVLAYLDSIGLPERDVKIVHMEQPAILSAFIAGQGDVAQTWAPFNYLHEREGEVVLAHGKMVNTVVPGAVIATKKFANEHPDLVAKWLQGYMKGVHYMISEPFKSAKYLQDYYKEVGIDLTYEEVLKEFKLRPLFGIYDQLMLFSREETPYSTYDKWIDSLGDFYLKVKRIKKKPDVRTFITNKFLKVVEANMMKMR